MRHRKSGKKLNMGNAHRKAVIRNMLTSLIENEEIQTTDTRCKVLKREFDKLITLSKKGTVHARRQAAGKVFKPEAVQKLFDELGPRYEGRPGGYSRIFKLGQRRGDGAPVSIIRLLPEGEVVEPKQENAKADATPKVKVEAPVEAEEVVTEVSEAPEESKPEVAEEE